MVAIFLELARKGESKDPVEAEADFDEARSVFRGLVADFPLAIEFSRDYAEASEHRAVLAARSRRLDVAESACDESWRIWDRLRREHPTIPEFQHRYSLNAMLLSGIRRMGRQLKRGRGLLLTEAIPASRWAYQIAPQVGRYRGAYQFALKEAAELSLELDDLLTRADFITALGRYKVSVLQYTAEDLAQELCDVD